MISDEDEEDTNSRHSVQIEEPTDHIKTGDRPNEDPNVISQDGEKSPLSNTRAKARVRNITQKCILNMMNVISQHRVASKCYPPQLF